MINVQNGSKFTSQPIPTLPLASSSDVDFGIISYCDDAWSIQYRGEQAELTRSDEGDGDLNRGGDREGLKLRSAATA